MSEWAFVNGSVLIEAPGQTQEEKNKVVAALVERLPQIKGSEGAMCVQSIMLEGYGEHRNYGIVDDEVVVVSKTQDFYNLVLTGFLRDRLFEEVDKEVERFLIAVNALVGIRRVSVSVSGINENYEEDCNIFTSLPEDIRNKTNYEIRRQFYQEVING